MENNRRGGNGRRTEGRREYGNANSGKRPRISRSAGGERRGFDGERRTFDGPKRPFERRSQEGERNFERPGRSFDGPRKSFDGPRRPFGERKPFGERREFNPEERRQSGSNGERRNFGRDRNFGGERRFSSDRRSGGDRREFRGERRGFDAERRGFGAKKSISRSSLNYFRNEEESGIDRMIRRRPQIDNTHLSDNDMVKVPIKEEVRLNKYIANSGVCSRREADNFILAGVVTVNGEVVTELGTKVNINTDDIRFNGERLKGESKIYIVMNKPKGFVTTASDPHADKTVMDLLKGCPSRVFPVGRLDKNTTGVLMFTNDGEIAEKLTHPSYDKKKIYQVSLDNKLKQEDYDRIVAGVELSDGVVAADALEYIEDDDHRKIGIEIHSGKNRIVRRIFESLGYEVKALDRVYFAGLTKKGLKRGEWRYLSEGETNLLRMGAYV